MPTVARGPLRNATSIRCIVTHVAELTIKLRWTLREKEQIRKYFYINISVKNGINGYWRKSAHDFQILAQCYLREEVAKLTFSPFLPHMCACNVMKKVKCMCVCVCGVIESERCRLLLSRLPARPAAASPSPPLPLKVLPLPASLIESGSISLASCCNPPAEGGGGGGKL